MTLVSFWAYSSTVMPTSLSPWCQRTARNPPGPSWRTRVIIQLNSSPPGRHALVLVPPWPVEAMPIGSLYLANIASPNAGHGLPPPLLSWTPGCGSSAICHADPLKLETMPDDWVILCSPELVELDCPAMRNTSPTPTFSIVTGAPAG